MQRCIRDTPHTDIKTLPKSGGRVLVWVNDFVWMVKCWFCLFDCKYDCNSYRKKCVDIDMWAGYELQERGKIWDNTPALVQVISRLMCKSQINKSHCQCRVKAVRRTAAPPYHTEGSWAEGDYEDIGGKFRAVAMYGNWWRISGILTEVAGGQRDGGNGTSKITLDGKAIIIKVA